MGPTVNATKELKQECVCPEDGRGTRGRRHDQRRWVYGTLMFNKGKNEPGVKMFGLWSLCRAEAAAARSPVLQYLLQSSSVHGWTHSDGALDKLQNLPVLIIWQGCWLFEGEVGAPLHPRVLSPSTCTLCI